MQPADLLLILVGTIGLIGGLLALRRAMPLLVEAVTNRHTDEEAFWRGLLTGDDPGVPMYWMRTAFGVVRSPDRCKVCNIPFTGAGSLLFQALWSGPSNLTPHFCKKCEDFAKRHHGGAEVEMTMLFVDVRGSTALAETMSAGDFRVLLNRFYAVATDILTDNGAWLDKFVGDEAIGLFIPGFAGNDHAALAVRAAKDLLDATGHNDPGGPWVPLGVGINTGPAFMGTVGTGKVCDITALGDEVNVAARLSSAAEAGQIVLSAQTHDKVGEAHTDFMASLELTSESLHLKGKRAPLAVYRYDVDGGLPRRPAPPLEETVSLVDRVDAELSRSRSPSAPAHTGPGAEGHRAPARSAPLWPGRPVGPYVTLRVLGVGGTARVWEVHHRATGTRHALKLLIWADPSLRRRLLREARAQAQLDHPNLLPLEDIIEVDGAPGLVMPLIDGPDLRQVLIEFRPSLDEALALYRPIVLGVAHAHRQGFVHRDLKPGNVLIDLRDDHIVPRVADFGLVKGGLDHTQTAPGAVMGTLAYAAPEQLTNSRTADVRADLWALGVVLFELTTGTRPFTGLTLGELLDAQRAGADVSGVPEPVRAVVSMLLQADPQSRLGNCEALLSALPPAPTAAWDGPLGRRVRALSQEREASRPTIAALVGAHTDALETMLPPELEDERPTDLRPTGPDDAAIPR